MAPSLSWRGKFSNDEYCALHEDAFGSILESDTVDWKLLTEKHSMGWVTAREDNVFVGFVNVIWDGRSHAWIQDLMVATSARHQGVGKGLVRAVRKECEKANCEWLHVDFEDQLAAFYIDACGFQTSSAGLINLNRTKSD